MYDQVIQEQLAEGVVERVTEEVNFGQPEFYLPHKAVIRENAESTKCRLYMMYQPGKTVLWSVLIRTRFKPITLCEDLQKAFLQRKIQGQYLLYIPQRLILAEKIVHEAQKRTMNEGVISTMTAVRENYWITKLQQLTKKVIKNCLGSKRFQVKPFATPP